MANTKLDSMIEDETKQTKVEDIEIDINALSSYNLEDMNVESEIDPESDAFEQVAPPPAGTYKWRITLQEQKGVVKKPSKQGGAYFSINFVLFLESEDEGLNGAMVYAQASTIIGRGKHSSTLITIMAKCGVAIPAGAMSPVTQLQLLAKWIKTEPKTFATIDWQARYEDPKTTGKWNTLYATYKDFPNNPEDPKKKQFKFSHKIAGFAGVIDVRARAQVSVWVGKKMTVPKAGTAASASTKPVVVALPKPPAAAKKAASAEVDELEAELEIEA